MSALPRMLREAAEHKATEVILEAGQVPVVRSDAGYFRLGDAWSERELFDALEGVLAPEQLAELAVGNVVEFFMDVHGSHWTLLSEPSADGVIVRGRLRADEAVDLGAPLELPPLAPFVPGERQAMGTGEGPRATAQRWAVLEPVDDDDVDEDPQWLVRNDEGRGSGTPIPMTERGDVYDIRDELPELIDPNLEFEGAKAAPTAPEGSLRRQTVEDLEATGEAELAWAVLAERILPGSLCLIQGDGCADLLAEHLDGSVVRLESEGEPLPDPTDTLPPLTVIVRLEDPSLWLGWLLRRVEEGARVLIETRSTTAAGARRVVLGVSHGPGAQAWLDAVPLYWLHEGDDGMWVLEPGAPSAGLAMA